MSTIYGKLRCPLCSMVIKRQDKVVLDMINTVIHYECYHTYTSEKTLLPIKDEGSFRKMVATYEFFWDE